jgi:hypothetical protein
MKKLTVKELRIMFPDIKIRRKKCECTCQEYESSSIYKFLVKNNIKVQLKIF